MNEKPIHIISLAKRKLVQRGIDEDWILETIRDPEQIVDGYGGRRVAQKKYKIFDKEYMLRVIYEEQDEHLLVITGYLTSQISRYL